MKIIHTLKLLALVCSVSTFNDPDEIFFSRTNLYDLRLLGRLFWPASDSAPAGSVDADVSPDVWPSGLLTISAIGLL